MLQIWPNVYIHKPYSIPCMPLPAYIQRGYKNIHTVVDNNMSMHTVHQATSSQANVVVWHMHAWH